MRFVVEQMRAEHIPAVTAIDRAVYPIPWPVHSYRSELHNRQAYYIVVCRVDAEAHVEPPAEVGASARGESGGLLSRLSRLLRPGTVLTPAEEVELRRVVGYAGLWLMVNEAHITTIAVAPEYQGRGLGELLLLSLIDKAIELGAQYVTLEVRVSNYVAQNLYRKYTFRQTGLRKRYYSDNGEDAYIMTTEALDSPQFQQVLAANRAALLERLARDD
ncbi:MAG TPA: ribosomal protein S18-alanine N-acetyltransferase [Chloroflexota bacterium]|jgi:ribosomal-protein-alanine N-acetyltransferase|nr:ribosomal protein S18-alanine N-acetyltransferase [Chloroflexota bacterium]